MGGLGFSARRRHRFSLPLLLLLFLFLAGGGGGVVAGDDRDTLLAISKDWSSPPQLTNSWNTTAVPDHCSWLGVTCAAASAGVVTGLVLPRLNLTGTIPDSVCELKNLTHLDLSYNHLTGAFPAAALYACAELRFVDLSNNQFSGPLPRDIYRLSPALEHLNLSSNSFSGEVPPALARVAALMSLVLYNNSFSGDFPAKIWSLIPKLNFVVIQNNIFTGTLPARISSNISLIEMGNNVFSGSFPTSAPGLKVFHAENNRLVGELPSDMSKLASLTDLSVSGNRITGSMPASIGLLRNLSTLDLSGNRISGAIPAGTIGLLPELTTLDLSDNLLTGSIPWDISNHIKNLNLSSNQLTGEVPEQLLQDAAYDKSFLDNPGLCARAGSSAITNLPACRGGRTGARGKRVIILFGIIVAGTIIIAGCIGACLFFRCRRKERVTPDWKMTAFTQLNFTASEVVSQIHEENVIGVGGSGKVYRVHLGGATRGRDEEDGMRGAGRMALAVKRISDPRNYSEQFEAEVKALGNTRHKNIVKLLCCIAGPEKEANKLLVYEYMEKGSLDLLLHHPAADGAPLDWPTRLAIAIDAAKGLKYLHHDCEEPIVNCDVKSSNILLGPDFKAKIGDFGLAQALVGSLSPVGGTPGYMAPEILQGAQANEKLDVYSFGVVLLELTTGKEATDGGGVPGVGLAGWSRLWYQQEGATFDDIVDEAIRNTTDMQPIQSVFTLGLMCTSDNPLERPSMEEVLRHLTQLQCQQTISAEQTTTEAFPVVEDYEDDEGEGGGALLLQNGRPRRSASTWFRQLRSTLSMVITRRPILMRGRSHQGLQLLERRIRGTSEPRVNSFALMHAARAHTN